MELIPIIKEDVPLQVIVVYELGEDQSIDISTLKPSLINSTINEILQLAEWWNKDDTFISNKYDFRSLDTITHIYLYKITNGIEYKSKNIYLKDVKL